MERITCADCGQPKPGHDIVNFGSAGSYRQLCTQCFNSEMAKLRGIKNFENYRLDPIGIQDCAGEFHEFHFQTRLLGNIVALDAFELKEGQPAGYQFQIVGAVKEDLLTLLARLVEKIRRPLSVKHISLEGHDEWQIVDQAARGRIEWDDTLEERTPLLVIDGQKISWEEFGRMLMTFEGWQFKLEISDRSEEV